MNTAAPRSSDPVGLTWLVTVRWTVLVAAAGALVAGRAGLGTPLRPWLAIWILAAFALSNTWLMWRVRAERPLAAPQTAGLLVSADVVLLTWVLWRSGGVLNPASVFYLVQIVLAALVLGRTWTWIVTALTVGGYGALFLAPAAGLNAAAAMHPEIAAHMSGMWLAFSATALVIAVLVARLVVAIERRDRALEDLRDRHARATHVASLATLAAGAAHELGTPLATMAVAAGELERSLDGSGADSELTRDARLIRTEVDRCRRILDDLASRSGGAPGEAPRAARLTEVLAAVEERLSAGERERVQSTAAPDVEVVWPVQAVAGAVLNLVRNALQASTNGRAVVVEANAAPGGQIHLTVADAGPGMSAADLARAGEPFFTTKKPGEGTGLGLFVARTTIEQLGGTLSIASEPGHGTTVTIALPHDVLSRPHAHD